MGAGGGKKEQRGARVLGLGTGTVVEAGPGVSTQEAVSGLSGLEPPLPVEASHRKRIKVLAKKAGWAGKLRRVRRSPFPWGSSRDTPCPGPTHAPPLALAPNQEHRTAWPERGSEPPGTDPRSVGPPRAPAFVFLPRASSRSHFTAPVFLTLTLGSFITLSSFLVGCRTSQRQLRNLRDRVGAVWLGEADA